MALTIDVPHAFPAGRILAAGQPDARQFESLRAAGFTAVVNLRAAGEFDAFDERALVESLGLRYHHLPVAGAAGVTWDNARRLQALLAADGDGPVLVHCGTANRVGALVALAAALDGADAGDALAAGRQAGLLGLEGHVRTLLSSV